MKENLEMYKFLITETRRIADETEKEAASNDVEMFKDDDEKESWINGFTAGACWQKGRGDAKCVDFAEWVKDKFVPCCDKNGNCWWETENSSEKQYTSKEVFEEYDKNIKSF